MSESKPPIIAESATPHERRLVDLGWELEKQAVPNLNDTLGRLLTLATAVFGGVLVVIDKGLVRTGFSLVALVAVMGGILLAVWGLVPRPVSVARNVPAEVERVEGAAAERKYNAVFWTLVALAVAFVAVAVGAMVRLFSC